jgi:hypothetical protein
MTRSTAPAPDVKPIVRRPPAPDRVDEATPLSPLAQSQRPVASRRASARHFFRHFGEMFLAMMVGMFALGALDALILSAAGTSVRQVRDSAPEAFAFVMALNMTVGMTMWMRYRRHSWAMCVEMAAAMFVPAAAAIVLFWCSVIHSHSIGGVEMSAMVPAMIAVMLLRRVEYSQPVHVHPRDAAEGS